MLGLLASQATGVAFMIGVAIWAIDAALLWFAIRTFSRARLLTRL